MRNSHSLHRSFPGAFWRYDPAPWETSEDTSPPTRRQAKRVVLDHVERQFRRGQHREIVPLPSGRSIAPPSTALTGGLLRKALKSVRSHSTVRRGPRPITTLLFRGGLIDGIKSGGRES